MRFHGPVGTLALTAARPTERGALVKAEIARWGDVAKRYNIEAE